ncbi:MAG: tol-pal system-associated acyl-CoA thioesterase [Octadecabacter sp.]|nr:tol-pal system-associated acyl-CoA thioesterase [Octadecabacter sp.]
MTHRFPLRVYYEDTDFGGIVYYANYLKFIERGRSEWVREMGIDQVAMKRDEGVVFAVRRVEADYHAPARYDDELVVNTDVETVTGARLIVRQTVARDSAVLFSALVTIVAINEAGAPARLPAAFRRNIH